MKKFLLSLFGVVAMCGAVSAQEHPKNIVGLRAGYAPSWVTSYGVATSVRHGFMVGVTDQVLLSPKVPFYFETGLNFISKGYAIRGYDNSRTSFNYLQLPIGINYHIRAGRYVTIEPAAGFYYAVGLNGSRTYNDITSNVFTDGSTSRHDFGFACGVSTSIYEFYFGISYEMGFINIDKNDKIYGDSNAMIGYKKLKNNSIIIKVGVNF